MTTQTTIALVCNPQAGKGKAWAVYKQVEQLLRQKKHCFKSFAHEWPQNFIGFTDVFVFGGDGTLNYFINRYPGIQLPVSVFKGGSGNDFAWKLYGDCSTEQQLDIALHAAPKKIDAGSCNERFFLNGVGIGFDGEVVKAMGRKRFMPAGHMAYLWTVIKKIAFYRETDIRLRYDGILLQRKFFMISIANGSRYGGGFKVAPQACIDDGKLDIVMIKCIHRLKRLFYLPMVEKGKHLKLSIVETGKGEHFVLNTSAPVAAHIDGELVENDSFEVKVLPGKYLFRF